MLDSMFGLEFPLPMKFFIAFAIVLILIGTAAYLLRRFGSGALAASGQRNRQPRLALVDATPIDNRRKLVIVRRDNVEHLLLIGGPTDLLVEPNIVRGSTVQNTREIPAVRTAAVEPLALPEATGWPLAPESEPQPALRAEPVIRPVAPPAAPPPDIPLTHPPQVARVPEPPAPPPAVAPAPRMATPAPIPVAPPPAAAPPHPQAAEPVERSTAPEVRAPQTIAHPNPSAPIEAEPAPMAAASLAAPQAEVARAPAAPTMRTKAETAARPPEPPPALRKNEEQNLAEMALRLEAALSRPAPAPPPQAPARPAPPPPVQRPQAVPPPPAAVQRPAAPSYENLQREMASLLGRQTGGS